MPNDELMTTGDVAKAFEAAGLVGKSTRTVQRLAENGELAYAQKIAGGPSGIYLFEPRVVREYLASLADRTAKASA